MPEMCDLLGLHPDALPDSTIFYYSIGWYAMYVWPVLLRDSARQHPQSGHVVLDSTFFERKQAPSTISSEAAAPSRRSKRRR